MSIGTALFFLEISGYAVKPLIPYTWEVSKEGFRAVVGEYQLNLLAEACDQSSDFYRDATEDLVEWDDAVKSKIEQYENQIQDLEDEIGELQWKITKLEAKASASAKRAFKPAHELVFGKVAA